jgi:hypothetical protein
LRSVGRCVLSRIDGNFVFGRRTRQRGKRSGSSSFYDLNYVPKPFQSPLSSPTVIASMPCDPQGRLSHPHLMWDACRSPVQPSAPQQPFYHPPSDTLATWEVDRWPVGNRVIIYLYLARPLKTDYNQIAAVNSLVSSSTEVVGRGEPRRALC